VNLHRVESTVEGDIDLLASRRPTRSATATSRSVSFVVDGDAPRSSSRRSSSSPPRSAVYDVLTNGTDVVIDVATP